LRMNLVEIIRQIAQQKDFFFFEDLLHSTKIKREALWVIVSRLEKEGFIRRIEKGKYLIVPLSADREYTLHEFIIGSVLVEPYAIAYWSALNYHGLTEQIPGSVFLQTTSWKEKQSIDVFGVNYRIVRVKSEKFFGLEKIWIENAQINITDKEKTIIDCLDKPHCCGGLIEPIKALKNGHKELDFKKLALYANHIGNTGVVRRLGYICDVLNLKIDLQPVRTRNYLLLDPTSPTAEKKSAKWRLIVNLEEEKLRGEL